MAQTLDDQRFCCSVCLEIYVDPVSTPCGHNFCKLCLEKYWDTSKESVCPLCKEVFHKRPSLRVNCSFREVVEHYRNTNTNTNASPVAVPPQSAPALMAGANEVACDVCKGMRVKATKSCLACLASFCERHLEPHRTTAALSRHRLTEPVVNLKNRICRQHQAVVELFCRKEDQLICQICAQTEHRRHQVVLVEAAAQQKMIQIKRRGKEVELMIQDRKKRIEEINRLKEHTAQKAQRELEASDQAFWSLMAAIKDAHAELVAKISARNEVERKKFEELVEDLRNEIGELERKSVEIQQISDVQDHVTILERFSQAYKLPSTRGWSAARLHEVNFLGFIRTSLIKAGEFINLEIRRQSANELSKVRKFAEEVVVDPDSAGPWLVVSDDGRELRQSLKKQKVPADPTRFTENTMAVATRALTQGRHYWEVGVREKSNWLLGVASGAVRRQERIAPSPQNGLWTLCLQDGRHYFACTANPSLLTLTPPPQRVGVFVDFMERCVAFYDADAKTHIAGFSDCDFGENLYPVFDPCLAPENKETAPLRVMVVLVQGRAQSF